MTYPAVKIPIQAKDRRLESLVPQGGIERRERIRFPLELRARYRTLERRRPLVGRGWVMNMSSGGVLVASSHEISTGAGLELSIEWPFLLDGRVPLQLVASGKVVRSGIASFALLLTRHQFRTTKKRIVVLDPPHADLWDQPAMTAAGA